MPFEKGNTHGKGRPEGSLNKATINNLKLDAWLDRIAKDVELLDTPEKRIEIEMQIVDRILAKSPNMPGSPSDSVGNVDKMIEAYENQKVNVNP